MKYKAIRFCLTLSVLLVSGFLDAQDLGPVIAEAEAEDGVLTGVTVQTSYPGYSGTGYVANFSNDGDQVTMTVNVPDSGLYKVIIWYGGFSGTKTQNVVVNGNPGSNVVFPASESFTWIDAGTYFLGNGENSVSIQKNWGYMTVDKIQIYAAVNNSFVIDKELVDPNANEEAIALYEFLKAQFGERIISGQTRSYFSELSSLAEATPMLKAGDLSSYTEGYPYLWKDGGHTFGATDDGTVADLINWHNSSSGKGLVSLHWHWHSPSGGVAGQNNFYTENTDFDIREAVKPGTEENLLIIRDIDAIAIQLKRFEDAGVPVLWRPLHEAGGGWFWWGAQGPEACKQLYDILYERLMHHHHLHNLLWVWSTPEEDWYPGNTKVDIIGHDSYPGANNYSAQKYWFDRLYDLTEGKKLIAMTENGPIPDPDECFKMEAPWLFFMSWSNLVEEQNEKAHLLAVYSHPTLISLESNNSLWRSSLFPDTWEPGYKDAQGRFYHDFSYAGYHLGEDSIPFITSNLVDVTLPPYNADNTGVEDVTTIIQAALDDVGVAGGGVVYLPAGTYRIKESSSTAGANAALHMKYDNVVLRGDGPESTFIFHDQNVLRQKDIVHIRKEWSSWDTKRGTETKISKDLMNPTLLLPVESVSGFSVGDLVIVRNDFTPDFVEEHLMDGIWNMDLDGVMFIRKIDSIDATHNYIIIDIPTRYYLKIRDNARVYHAGGHIKECGIESLSFGNLDNPKTGWEEEDYTIEGTGAYDVHGSHVMQFKYAQDCWVRNVSTYKPSVNVADIEVLSNCLLMQMSRNITVESCNFQKSQYEGGGGNGYMYTFSGNDCLAKDSRANDSRHNYDFKYPFSNGNVILNCRGENSKYSSDFHMYLSMANLIDGFVVDGDYLECAFRPYGGTVIHGYPSTQSVFYNTKGESYHVSRDYIIDSRQFGWGYVTGTSGVADRVKTTPVAGTQSGYTFDTAPEDFVEGEGQGSNLRPVSLYYDQFHRRQTEYRPVIRYFKVKVEVKDALNGQLLTGAEVILNDTMKLTGADGLVSYSGINEFVSLSASKEKFYPYTERSKNIHSDTTLRISLSPFEYDIKFQVLDSKTLDPFWGVNITFNGINKVSDDNGYVTYTYPEGNYDYLIDKLSYQNESGTLNVTSDTVFRFYLTRTEAFMKFRLKEGTKPINKAFVSLGSDSVESNNLGISLFSQMPVNTDYNYTVRKEGYDLVTGSLFLETDTDIHIEMVPENSDTTGIWSRDYTSRIWPNPASNFLIIEESGYDPFRKGKIADIQGRIIMEFALQGRRNELNIEGLETGIYHLHIISGKEMARYLFVKN